jgi:hypothetical protein
MNEISGGFLEWESREFFETPSPYTNVRQQAGQCPRNIRQDVWRIVRRIIRASSGQ